MHIKETSWNLKILTIYLWLCVSIPEIVSTDTTVVLIFSNRVEAWTRNVDFLLHQEGRPVAELIGDKKYRRVMKKDWETTDKAKTWIRSRATNLTQPFALYLGLNLPHPYPSPSSGENYGASTFLTSPYWLERVCKPIQFETALTNMFIRFG